MGDGEIIANKIEHVPDHIGRQQVDFNDVFEKQTHHEEFYESIKRFHVPENMEKDQVAAFMQYFESCQKQGIRAVVNPRLIYFWNRGYHLFN